MPIRLPSVLAQVTSILNDVGNVAYTVPEILEFANAGQREIVNKVPEAHYVQERIVLRANDALQVMPAGTIRLLGIHRNIRPDGSFGRVVKRIDRGQLDLFRPDWHQAGPADEVVHFVYDEDTPMEFWVYKRPNAGVSVDARVSKVPPEILSLAETTPLDATYANALVNYILYRLMSKQNDETGSSEAASFYQAFMNCLDLKVESDTKANTE